MQTTTVDNSNIKKNGSNLKIGDLVKLYSTQVHIVTHIDTLSNKAQMFFIKTIFNNYYQSFKIPIKLHSPIITIPNISEIVFDIYKEDIVFQQEIRSNDSIYLEDRFPKLVLEKNSGEAFIMAKNIKEGAMLYNMVCLKDFNRSFVLPSSLIFNYELAPSELKVKIN